MLKVRCSNTRVNAVHDSYKSYDLVDIQATVVIPILVGAPPLREEVRRARCAEYRETQLQKSKAFFALNLDLDVRGNWELKNAGTYDEDSDLRPAVECGAEDVVVLGEPARVARA